MLGDWGTHLGYIGGLAFLTCSLVIENQLLLLLIVLSGGTAAHVLSGIVLSFSEKVIADTVWST